MDPANVRPESYEVLKGVCNVIELTLSTKKPASVAEAGFFVEKKRASGKDALLSFETRDTISREGYT